MESATLRPSSFPTSYEEVTARFALEYFTVEPGQYDVQLSVLLDSPPFLPGAALGWSETKTHKV